MKKALRLLLVEDSDLDAAHLLLELKRGGFDVTVTRVETREEFENALYERNSDVIISDYHLPRFGAPEALAIHRQAGIDIPFIVVSGAVGEETAVELMREGAHDYVLKHRLTRLAAAVERELQQVATRHGKRRAEDLFQTVLRASPLPGMLVDRATGWIVDGSDTYRRQFLEGKAFSAERGIFDIVEFSQPERIQQLIARGSGTAWGVVYYTGGAARVANVRAHSVEHEGLSYVYLSLDDVTEQHYLKAAFDAVADPVLIVNGARKLLYANRAAEELFGNLYFGMEIPWWPDLGDAPTQRIAIEGQPYDAGVVPFRFAGESQTSTILTLHNVSEEEELLRQATRDPLTGVYNTRYFESAVGEQLAGGGTLALLDLDHFKPINDELGHAAGDAALIAFAGIVRASLREADIFARLGGDEFAVFFPALGVSDAVPIVASIYTRIAATPFRHDQTTRPLNASTGLASASATDTVPDLKRRADQALYEAKRQGRGRWVVG
jgi:diguanylate cyclase (GGDEF)-like protein